MDMVELIAQQQPQGEVYGVLVEKDTAKEFANVFVPALLFALLVPGGILHIPPKETGPYAGQYFTPGLADWRAIAVHTVVFALLYYLIRLIFPQSF